jgi:hypothetical protein
MNINPIFEDLLNAYKPTATKPLAEATVSALAKAFAQITPDPTPNKKKGRKMFIELNHDYGKIIINLNNVLHVMPWEDGIKLTLMGGQYLLCRDTYEDFQIALDAIDGSVEI